MVLRRVWLRCYFCTRREGKLASDNNCLVGFDTTFDHSEVAVLTLTGLNRAKLDSVVRFYYKDEGPALANLHGLLRYKHGVLKRIQNETHPDKLRWP